ncbi:MAG: AbrB/MazE/SpoVT family DNA-binding domain-containing protein [Thermodesulfobacteriota bacterium]
MQATLTSKGQVTLPKKIREKLGLSAGDQIEFFLEDDQNVRLVLKHVPINQLRGMLPKPAKPVSLEEMDKAIRDGADRQ